MQRYRFGGQQQQLVLRVHLAKDGRQIAKKIRFSRKNSFEWGVGNHEKTSKGNVSTQPMSGFITLPQALNGFYELREGFDEK